MTVPFDYDAAPERYRLGMQVTRTHASASLYEWIAEMLTDLQADLVLDVGCADGPLRAALPETGPHLVGLDASTTMLQEHPPPAVHANATQLPFADQAADAVTAVNVLDHLPDPLPALREAHRVLRTGGHLLAAAIARTDSPELECYWRPSATSFDAEDASSRVAQVFDTVTPHPWDAPLVQLPTTDAIRAYLIGRQAPPETAERAARNLPTPLTITKRGVLIHATKRQSHTRYVS